MYFDLAIFTFLHQFAGRSRLLDGVGFFFADTVTYLLVAGLCVFALRFSGARRTLFATAEMMLAFLIARGIFTTFIQYFFVRTRPFAALDFEPMFHPNTVAAFPSAHMAGLFAAAYVIYRLDRRWGWPYFILAFLVGLGRVYAGIHWPLDILGGIAIGLLGGWIADRVARKEREQLFPVRSETSA